MKQLMLVVVVLSLACVTYVVHIKIAGLQSTTSSEKDVVSMYNVRLCTQRERLTHLRKVCSSLPSGPQTPAAHSIVDNKHQLMYCYVAKAGSTTFMAMLYEAAGHKTFNISASQRILEVHRRRIQSKFDLLRFGSVSDKTKLEVLKNYFKFMNARHPFDRLVSAYVDKFLHRDKVFIHTENILKYAHPEYFQDEGNKNLKVEELDEALGIPTFSELLRWIVNTNTMDQHWIPVHQECHICANEWDALLRVETMEEDQRIVLKRLKNDLSFTSLPVRHSHRYNNQTSTFGAQTWKHLPFFANISKDIMVHLINIYNTELEAFGYQWDMEHSIAYCRIETNNGPCC